MPSSRDSVYFEVYLRRNVLVAIKVPGVPITNQGFSRLFYFCS